MELLKEILDKELPSDGSNLEVREASRSVLFDEAGLIPMLFVSRDNYHKLPGGGIEIGENKLLALAREVREEVGCEIEVTGEVGMIFEYRSRWNLKQTSYCYIGRIISRGESELTEKEIEAGFKIVWLTLDEAIAKVENDNPDNYEGWFIQQRDLEFLKKVKTIIA